MNAGKQSGKHHRTVKGSKQDENDSAAGLYHQLRCGRPEESAVTRLSGKSIRRGIYPYDEKTRPTEDAAAPTKAETENIGEQNNGQKK